ncbi:hypothetical protein OO17_13405 [Rhodopseudomonas palustris]|uniref:Uncharacterized protein n=1 Tax=Rhodopseudomonas palustris TaxID=1076 RepID=A0A0D7ENB5_RHOPL|nr:hypothetical protein OO17_13405 [Rhodopseudomonas palustris]
MFLEDLKAGALEAATFEAKVFAADAFATDVFGAAAFETFEAEAFTAVDLAAFALAVFALVEGASLVEVGERLLVAPRLADGAFFEAFETLFLRVFCDTACAWRLHAPVHAFTGTCPGRKSACQALECAYNSTFPAKINDL